MASFSFSACFSLLFFFVDDDDDDDFAVDDDDDLAVAVVVVVVAIVSMFAVEVFVGFVMVDSLIGVFFFPPPLNHLGPALFFVGAVPGFSFRGFIFFLLQSLLLLLLL